MYAQLLVPLDGSQAAERALPHAQSLAKAFGGRIHLLQVVSVLHEFEAGRSAGTDSYTAVEYNVEVARELTAARQTRAEEYLAATAARLEADGIQVETSVRQGSASENIIEYAEENNVDLIIMNTQGRGGIQRFLLGSVTDRVVRSSRVPVLAIPPTD